MVLENKQIQYKHHGKLYYWWQRKKEFWYYLTKGKFFVCKSLVGDNKELLSEWYLLSKKNGDVEWKLKPEVCFTYLSGVLLIITLRKRDTSDNTIYSLITVGDYMFIDSLTKAQNGKHTSEHRA